MGEDTKQPLSLVWIKVVGIGNAGTGKTCLIRNFCERKYSKAYQPTVGVDYGFKIETIQDINLRVHLWDFAGSSEYIDVRNELYEATDAVFLVFDVTNLDSFKSLDVWFAELGKFCSSIPEVCIIGNKVDLKNTRKVSMNEGKKWAAQHGLRYFETSCLTSDGVQRVFTELLQAVVAKKKTRNEL